MAIGYDAWSWQNDNVRNVKQRRNGDLFDGEIKDGALSSRGVMTFKSHPNFIKYDGNWKEGSFEGYGHLLLKNEEQYRGNWAKGERNGLGHHIFAKTSPFLQYKGNWLNDHFNGVGVLT